MFKVFLIYYLLVFNIAAFAAMGIDKWKAKTHRWRIRERTLLLLAAVGGSIGALAGMYLFRHKTRHAQFAVGLPVFFVIHCLALYFFGR